MKKTVCLLFGILMIMITMTACGKSKEEKQIIGTWRHEGATYVSVLTFNEDMTCAETQTLPIASASIESTKSGTYEISKGTLMIYFGDKMEYLANIRFEDDKMIWASIFDDVIYRRVS